MDAVCSNDFGVFLDSRSVDQVGLLGGLECVIKNSDPPSGRETMAGSDFQPREERSGHLPHQRSVDVIVPAAHDCQRLQTLRIYGSSTASTVAASVADT